jgi:hypothetical protein
MPGSGSKMVPEPTWDALGAREFVDETSADGLFKRSTRPPPKRGVPGRLPQIAVGPPFHVLLGTDTERGMLHPVDP